MKTLVRFLVSLNLLYCGLAWGHDQAALAEFEERVKQCSLPQDAAALTAEVMAAKDEEFIGVCLRYPLAASMIMGQYVDEPPSEFKDRLTTSLIEQPWKSPAEVADKESSTPIESFKPYADYIKQRLGDSSRIGSPEELEKAFATADGRDRLVRKFKSELVKAGLAEGRAATTRPRKDWTPGHDPDSAAGEGTDTKTGGTNSTLLLVGAAVLVAAVGGYVLFFRKAA